MPFLFTKIVQFIEIFLNYDWFLSTKKLDFWWHWWWSVSVIICLFFIFFWNFHKLLHVSKFDSSVSSIVLLKIDVPNSLVFRISRKLKKRLIQNNYLLKNFFSRKKLTLISWRPQVLFVLKTYPRWLLL